MKEIETSNRLYEDNGALYMTTTVAAQLDTDRPVSMAVTFILTGSRLVTNRYLDTKPFQQFIAYAEKHPAACTTPLALLAGLMEAFTERIADVLERVGGDLDNLSGSIFAQRGNGTPDSRDLRRMIERIGFNGELNSKSRESLVSLGRLLMFVQQSAPMTGEQRDRFHSISRDVTSLSDHASFLGTKVVVPAGGDARPDQHRAEQHHQDLLDRRGDADAADAGREHLRHELPLHARARLAPRLSVRARADGRSRADSLRILPPPGVAVVAHTITSMALFCDFENIALGVRDAKYAKFDIDRVLERLLLKGSIVVKKAYCDWERYREFKAPMHEASFEMIEIPHVRMSGKNSADIRMVVDALDLCYTKEHVDTFVIISGDSDFSPLVSKLRENNKFVIGVGVKSSTSDLLIANCDEFIYYDDLVRQEERKKQQRTRRKQPAKQAAESLEGAAAEGGEERGGPQAGSVRPGARHDRRARRGARPGREDLGLDGQAGAQAPQPGLQRELLTASARSATCWKRRRRASSCRSSRTRNRAAT